LSVNNCNVGDRLAKIFARQQPVHGLSKEGCDACLCQLRQFIADVVKEQAGLLNARVMQQERVNVKAIQRQIDFLVILLCNELGIVICMGKFTS